MFSVNQQRCVTHIRFQKRRDAHNLIGAQGARTRVGGADHAYMRWLEMNIKRRARRHSEFTGRMDIGDFENDALTRLQFAENASAEMMECALQVTGWRESGSKLQNWAMGNLAIVLYVQSQNQVPS